MTDQTSTAIVAGIGPGLGDALCRRLADAGYRVVGLARGLAQSLARELGPKGIHVGHLIIDGAMWGERARDELNISKAQCLDPQAVAGSCLHLLTQEHSAWTHELDIRPDVESF